MITFASLFLGLVLGMANVELVVGSNVATVQLMLDGHRVAELHAPWKTTVDMGRALLPHELEAVALDAQGRLVGRAHQWVNRPRTLAEAAMTLEDAKGGSGRAVRLTWMCLSRENPLSVKVSMDGLRVYVADPHRIELPHHDPSQLHFVRAELDFGESTSAIAELSFGGTRQTETSTSLTAIPILLAPNERTPSLETLDGWFEVSGHPARAMAIEEGPADVVFVLAGRAPLELVRLRRNADDQDLRAATLGPEQRFRFSWCVPLLRRSKGDLIRLFPATRDISRDEGSVLRFAASLREQKTTKGEVISNAVSVAGLTASERNTRRAVILIVGPRAKETSDLPMAEARRFLAASRIPIFVWNLGSTLSDETPAYEPMVDVSNRVGFGRAVQALSAELSRQRIVWLDGAHLPQNVALSSKAKGITLAE